MRFSFERTIRTTTSEQWLVFSPQDAKTAVASVDLHIEPTCVHASMVLLADLQEQEIDRLITDLDDDVVNMADLDKGNFFLTLYRGKELGYYKIKNEKAA